MKQLLKTTVPANSEVTVTQTEIDGKIIITTEIIPIIFKKGDIVHCSYIDYKGNSGNWISIIKENRGHPLYDHFTLLMLTSNSRRLCPYLDFDDYQDVDCNIRFATDDEKQQLFDALKKEGKQWNDEKLCIEDIPEELKIGDLAIFWDMHKSNAIIGEFTQANVANERDYYRANDIGYFPNAIKFKSMEQYDKFRKGEI